MASSKQTWNVPVHSPNRHRHFSTNRNSKSSRRYSYDTHGSLTRLLFGDTRRSTKTAWSPPVYLGKWISTGMAGYAIVGAKYGPSFLSLGECRKKNYDQILWVLGPECQAIEAGASDFFVPVKNRDKGRVDPITPLLDDKIILEGIARQSVLDLARSRLSDHLDVVETKFTMGVLQGASKEDRLLKAFVSGTAFFISPVSVIGFQGRDMNIPLKGSVPSGGCAETIKGWLRDIMFGSKDHEWGIVLQEE